MQASYNGKEKFKWIFQCEKLFFKHCMLYYLFSILCSSFYIFMIFTFISYFISNYIFTFINYFISNYVFTFKINSTFNFGKRLLRAGGLFGSVFSLVAATVGSGNITLAYAIMKNGYVLGPLIVTLGAMLSYYTSMLLVKSADFTGKVRYEDIAL